MSQPEEALPPGQKWGKRWIIYAAMGIPKIRAEDWHLKVTGMVKQPLSFTYDELSAMPKVAYDKSFFCVTSWSIKDPAWEGVSMKLLVEKAEPSPDAKWVMFHCADGYTAPVPVEDALREDSIVALKLEGKPLLAEQGFPARPFMPQLYGWKSAKWLTEIEFIPEYVDGYWEMYGYHERGGVAEEQRFKSADGRHTRKRVFGVI